jgi:hypothetical protein
MNDPRESKRWFMSHVSDWRSPPNAASGLWEAAEGFRQLVKVAAFATDNPSESNADVRFGSGYARPRMWAQYSANHTGACIIVERAELLNRFEKQFAAGDGPAAAYFTSDYVRYAREEALTASVNLGRLGGTDALSLNEIVRDYFINHWMEAFYLKHEDWRDEREFRLAVYEQNNAGPCYVDLCGAVAGLVLGVDFKDEHLAVARTFNDALNVGGRVARIGWDRLNHRLLPVADFDGTWTVSRWTGPVVANLHIGQPQPNKGP